MPRDEGCEGRKTGETEQYYWFTGSVHTGNNIFCKNIRDRVAFRKKCDYNKLFSMFGTTILYTEELQ